MIIVLRALMEKGDNMQEQIDNISKEMEILRNDQKEMLEIKNSNDTGYFDLDNEQYLYLSFKISNNLSKFGNTTITIDVYEYDSFSNSYNGHKKYANVTTISNVNKAGEFDNFSLIFRNFNEEGDARKFFIVLVIGPTKINESNAISEYASGNVYLKDFKVATGSTNQYKDEDKGIETDNYKLYNLYSYIANAEGFGEETSDSTETEQTIVGFTASKIDISNLSSRPVAPLEYAGIVPHHIYIKQQAEEGEPALSTAINTRTKGDADGNYAGVISSKYISYYPSSLQSALAVLGDEEVQPLMIHNETEGNYGFILTTGAKNINENSYAKIKVSLKVTGGATAYVYLVNTDNKEVLNFVDFNANIDKNGKEISPENQTSYSGDAFPFQFVVNEQASTSANEWIDLEFYIATGVNAKPIRVELWNGDRTGTIASKGTVFVKSVDIEISSTANFEPNSFNESFVGDNPLANAGESSLQTYLCYRRELTDIEKEFNKDYPDNKITYDKKIVWAKSNTMIYSIFSSLEVNNTDPYDTIVEEEEETSTGCQAETNPATFWLSFSSILLSAVLILAIVMLFVKNIRRRRKANASDAKSHYKVKSRISYKKSEPIETIEDEQTEIEEDNSKNVEEVNEDVVEENNEENIEEYIYGDVKDFGDEE